MQYAYSRAVFLSRPYNSFRDQRPGGSGLTFVQGYVATPIRPITGRHLLIPPSFTRVPNSSLRREPAHEGQGFGFTLFRSNNIRDEDPAFAPGGAKISVSLSATRQLGHIPFGSSLSATLACICQRGLQQFTCVGHVTKPCRLIRLLLAESRRSFAGSNRASEDATSLSGSFAQRCYRHCTTRRLSMAEQRVPLAANAAGTIV
jgi:hypothetical protein